MHFITSLHIVFTVYLQLSELLRHDTSLAPAVPKSFGNSTTKQPHSFWQKLVIIAKNLLKGRAATNLSLLMVILAVVSTPNDLSNNPYTASRNHSHVVLHNLFFDVLLRPNV
jgi:hypothetical protein